MSVLLWGTLTTVDVITATTNQMHVVSRYTLVTPHTNAKLSEHDSSAMVGHTAKSKRFI